VNKVIILGSSGEIGSFLSKKLSNTYTIIKASRSKEDSNSHYIDFSDRLLIDQFIKNNINSDIYGIINCYGIQKPIGNFGDTNFEDWEKNIIINFQNYSFFIHRILNQNLTNLRKVINFSGGGVTGPRKSFSAYAISKAALYKFTEILAEEYKDNKIDFNIIAPGSIKSKMTKEIIDVGSKLGDEYSSALKTSNEGGQEKENIVQLCRFLLSGKSNGITGKLIAAQWDNIEEYDLGSLKNDKNLFTLRRIDKKFFIEKKDTK
tara:strand:- start:339 stop:1124 length:786 start_codon:yes stop_codon:yes gene_type:complete